jgi:hypothetical protein
MGRTNSLSRLLPRQKTKSIPEAMKAKSLSTIPNGGQVWSDDTDEYNMQKAKRQLRWAVAF